MTDPPKPTQNDGRRLAANCKDCGPGTELSVEVDPADDTVFVVCRRCESEVLMAEVLKVRMHLTTQVSSLDEIDPRIRDGIDDVEELDQ